MRQSVDQDYAYAAWPMVWSLISCQQLCGPAVAVVEQILLLPQIEAACHEQKTSAKIQGS